MKKLTGGNFIVVEDLRIFNIINCVVLYKQKVKEMIDYMPETFSVDDLVEKIFAAKNRLSTKRN